MKHHHFPLRVFLVAYSVLWAGVLPLVLVYFFLRGRKDALYRRHLSERFGMVLQPIPGAIWVHTVSLGEFRSALPLIRALLDRGDNVHVTCVTPTGRREAQAHLMDDIRAGRARVTWLPLDMAWTCRRFLRLARPKAGLLMEMEFWPRLLTSADRIGLPVYFCNAQYPEKTFHRDQTLTRPLGWAMALAAGAMVKSNLHKKRFAARGVAPIYVTGELRFDQQVPAQLVAAGQALRRSFHAEERSVITIASAIEGEDELLADAIVQIFKRQPETLVVYVPRAPERFDDVARTIERTGLRLVRRSQVLGEDLAPSGPLPEDIQVLLGDSLGEMYAYLSMADRVVVGGGFVHKGAHNISEAFALLKPVWVGQNIWTIEYPAKEALAAGVLRIVPSDPAVIAREMCAGVCSAPEDVAEFFSVHSGALERTLAALDAELGRN